MSLYIFFLARPFNTLMKWHQHLFQVMAMVPSPIMNELLYLLLVVRQQPTTMSTIMKSKSIYYHLHFISNSINFLTYFQRP